MGFNSVFKWLILFFIPYYLSQSVLKWYANGDDDIFNLVILSFRISFLYHTYTLSIHHPTTQFLKHQGGSWRAISWERYERKRSWPIQAHPESEWKDKDKSTYGYWTGILTEHFLCTKQLQHLYNRLQLVRMTQPVSSWNCVRRWRDNLQQERNTESANFYFLFLC